MALVFVTIKHYMEDKEGVLKQADGNLYQAKALGKNRVIDSSS
ncbi:MAG: hypothetical protein PF447_05520 [Spirochaetaceae bacterium]|jgi:PleD family two-component response regulator|nr:hypothetical protein [Spirochaetaceae bacterium]